MHEIETVSRWTERNLTKMDIVKTEHDLICKILDSINEVQKENCNFNMDTVIPYIDGVRSMAEALMDLLEEESTQENTQD